MASGAVRSTAFRLHPCGSLKPRHCLLSRKVTSTLQRIAYQQITCVLPPAERQVHDHAEYHPAVPSALDCSTRRWRVLAGAFRGRRSGTPREYRLPSGPEDRPARGTSATSSVPMGGAGAACPVVWPRIGGTRSVWLHPLRGIFCRRRRGSPGVAIVGASACGNPINPATRITANLLAQREWG